MNGRKRTGTGRVHHAIRAVQVQSVGNSTCHDVAEQSGERVFLPGDVALRDTVDDIFGHIVGHARIFQSLSPARMSQPGSQRDDHLQRSGDTENAANS